MINLLGTIIFATVITVGTIDRNIGLRILQKYEPAWQLGGLPRDGSVPSASRRDRDS
jgi:hypothetical protein